MDSPDSFWRPLLLATVAATAMQPIVIGVWLVFSVGSQISQLHPGELLAPCSAVLVVAGIAVLVLGIPTFFLLRQLGCDTPFQVGSAGVLLAVAPLALLMWPTSLSGFSAAANWHGHLVDTYIDGRPTRYAWFEYLEGLAQFGTHGFVGSRVFLAVWRKAGGRPPRGPAGAA